MLSFPLFRFINAAGGTEGGPSCKMRRFFETARVAWGVAASRGPGGRRAAWLLLALLVACDSTPDLESGATSTVIAAGTPFPCQAPVLTFQDMGGYNGYAEHCWFDVDIAAPKRPVAGCEGVQRYGRRKLSASPLPPAPSDAIAPLALAELQEGVDQFVIHFDVCVNSRRCFEVLHDHRGLSVHFLLDLDGTVYQTLDLRERARHATIANDRSIGIEIAHIGAYAKVEELEKWYTVDAEGRRFSGAGLEQGLRTPGFIARPARAERFVGNYNGTVVYQYDFTEAQYRSLVALTRTLCRIFPKLRLEVPRDGSGAVRTEALSPAEFQAWSGLIGHHHIQKNKTDPGPAFDWDRLIKEAR